MGSQRKYNGNAREAAFLLGGVGTGNVSLGARGELRDWEIFNQPGKGNNLPYTFFSIRVHEEGKNPIAKILESELMPPFTRPCGFGSDELAGVPRFKNSTLQGEYPFAAIELEDDKMPVEVSVEAFNPLIPLNLRDSSIPVVYLNYRVKNVSDSNVDICIVGSICNPSGFNGNGEHNALNELKEQAGLKGLYMYSKGYDETHYRYGNATLAVIDEQITYKEYWKNDSWWDGAHDFWDDFI